VPETSREQAVSRILADHDPLPPWLSEAHWDASYYDREAARIVAELSAARSIVGVRQIVVDVFEQTFPGMLAYARTTDDRFDARLDAIASAIWAQASPWDPAP